MKKGGIVRGTPLYMVEVLNVLIPSQKRIKGKITKKKSAKTPKIALKRSDEETDFT